MFKNTKKKSQKLGKNTSEVEVLNISKNGIWLYVKPKEYFLSYEDFPWFKDARVSEICDVTFRHGFHLRWEQLDVDLELDSLEHPERYPLKYNPNPEKRQRKSAA